MSLGNDPEKVREHRMKPDVSYRKVKERNQPKLDWVQNGVMGVSEFNHLKQADDEEEYRERWKETKKKRRTGREERERERERNTRPPRRTDKEDEEEKQAPRYRNEKHQQRLWQRKIEAEKEESKTGDTE